MPEEKVPDDSKDMPPEYDPQNEQANRLPGHIWGSEEKHAHARPVGADGEPVEDLEEMSEEMGGGIGDPSKLTAD